LEKPKIVHVVLDVLKPHQPSLPEFTMYIGELSGLTKVDVSLVEMDEKTESLRVIIYGNNVDYDDLKTHMAEQGAVIHSVDQVVVE
jgi:hypothetical protein